MSELNLSNLKQKAGKEERETFAFLNKEISFGKKGWKGKVKQQFVKELALLLNSGLDLRSALELLVQEEENSKQRFIAELYEEVRSGVSLSGALKSQSWSDFEVNTISIGEESGHLGTVLEELGDYYERRRALKQQLVSVLSYPLFILFVGVGVVFFMLGAVVPLYADMFERFDSTLPDITVFVLAASKSVGAALPWLVSIGLVVVIGFLIFKDRPKVQRGYFKFLFALPLVGKLIQLSYTSRFATAMSLLLKAKLTVVSSLELTKTMMNCFPYEQSIERIIEKMINGFSLGEAMKSEGLFPSKMKALVIVGQEVNKLGEMFDELKTLYRSELDHKSALIGKMLEPILIIFVAVFVGIILIAMYLPMFELSKVMGS